MNKLPMTRIGMAAASSSRARTPFRDRLSDAQNFRQMSVPPGYSKGRLLRLDPKGIDVDPAGAIPPSASSLDSMRPPTKNCLAADGNLGCFAQRAPTRKDHRGLQRLPSARRR
jgi:hypothetical protein